MDGDPVHLTAHQQQDQLLNTFVNVQQFDKLLFYLETSILGSGLNCPSSFYIKILLSLCTLSTYNNNDLILKEFPNQLSEQPIHIRSFNLLKRLIKAVSDHNDREESVPSDPFNHIKFDDEDVRYARVQLTEALDFIGHKGDKHLRSRTIKRSYDEDSESVESTPNGKLTSTIEWSPQKRALEKEFESLRGVPVQLTEEFSNKADTSDDDQISTVEYKSSKILHNDRIDIALGNDKIWNCIGWCLKNSVINSRLNFEIFSTWSNILSVIFDIIELDLEEYLYIKSTGDDKDTTFSQTLLFKFLSKVGEYNWAYKVSDQIFTNDSSKATYIFNNELYVANSIYLTKPLRSSFQSIITTPYDVNLRRRIFYMAVRALEEVQEDTIQTHKFRRWSYDDLISSTTVKLIQDGNYHDFFNFFHLDHSDLDDDYKIIALGEILVCSLVQITTFKFDIPQSGWIFDVKSLSFLINLLENVTFEKKYYDYSSGFDYNKLTMDFSRLNLILFIMVQVWVYCSKTELSPAQKQLLYEKAKIGEQNRLKVVQSCKKPNQNEDEPLHFITDLMSLKFELW